MTSPAEERKQAFRASALLARGLVIVHQQPHFVIPQSSPDDVFRCGWCERDVPMREMRSHGGTSLWTSLPRDAAVGEVKSGDGRVVVGCWEMFPPAGKGGEG